jgi:hypothetical protein
MFLIAHSMGVVVFASYFCNVQDAIEEKRRLTIVYSKMGIRIDVLGD